MGRRQEGTGLWFVVSPEFTNWLQGTKQNLFCPGIPGAGKTMIVAIAVDHIWKAFQGDNVGVAYIYCNYKRRETQTATDLLAAILKQLVQERPLYGEPVATLHKRHANRRTYPSLDEIRTALNSVLSNYSKAYIIIDALDECTDIDGTPSKLLTILRSLQATTNTSLMATSRFAVRIEQSFQGLPMLEIRASDADVTRFVAGHIHQLPKCVQRDVELQTEIQDGIVLAVNGM
jgi:Cdc6-like AAA superfamily ATPase